MKKLFFLLLLSVFYLEVKAQEYQMVIQKTDGSFVYYHYDDLSQISFNDTAAVFSYQDSQTPDLNLSFSKIQKIYFTQQTGLYQAENTDVFVYPNPASSYLKVVGADNQKIEIYSLDGKKVYNERIAGNIIDISLFDKGIYVVKINGKTLKFTKL